MDGLLMMNFLSRFFTPLLSELSEELCFSLELPNISGGGGGVRGQGSDRVLQGDEVRQGQRSPLVAGLQSGGGSLEPILTDHCSLTL